MRKLLLLALINLPLFIQAQSLPTQYSRVRISLKHHSIQDIARLGLEADHGQYAKGKHLINDFSTEEIRRLELAGIPYTIDIPDVKQWYRDQVQQQASTQRSGDDCFGGPAAALSYQTPANYQAGSMGGYFTYQEMLDNLDSMAAKYPNLISTRQPIGSILTQEGRPIQWLRISDNPNQDEA
ncbi:MAG: hypothetical protein AAF206_22505, partial [Bacteroidota bacterium]